MELLFLTKTGGILGPFAVVLGWIINYIYKCLELIGIPNIGLVIILFTLIVNLILLPMTIKQQKYTKLSAVMNPEIQKIQAKYKGKKDEVSMRRMQAETQAVYQKYGTSTMGGCLYMIIQLPILFALYQVIYNIPAYVDSVYAIYEPLAEGIFGFSDGMNQLNTLIQELGLRVTAFTSDTFTTNRIIDMLYNLATDDWVRMQEVFGTGIIQQEAVDTIIHINSFIGGLNISDPPLANGWWPGVLIPILSGVSQWASIKITSAQNITAQQNDKDNPMGNSMKMMNTIMPLFSVFLCFSVQIGLGLYWIASAVFRTLISVVINKYLDKEGVDAIIEKNREKAKKKAEKRGDKPSRFEEYAKQSTKNIEMAEAAQKRKSIKELANTSVEGNISGKNQTKKANNTSNTASKKAENDITEKMVTTAHLKDDDGDDRKKKSGKKGDSGSGNIAAYANMLKKK